MQKYGKILWALTILWLAGCTALNPLETETPVPQIPETPVHALEKAPTQTQMSSADPENFFEDLQNGLIQQDFNKLESLMQDPFTLAGWQAESYQTDVQTALSDLRSHYLFTGSIVTFSPVEDLQGLLGGMDAYGMWGPNAGISHVLYSQGWGADGKAEALLPVSQGADGTYRWYGILYAPAGFQPAATENTTGEVDALSAFQQTLIEALTGPAIDEGRLVAMMSNPFIIEGWMGSGAPWSPVEALELLKTDRTPSPSPENYFYQYDFVQLLNGKDPHLSYGSAVGFIYSRGWGADGNDEVLLVISGNADGSLVWSHILIAPDGFRPLP